MKTKLLILYLFLCLNGFSQKLPITGLCWSTVHTYFGVTCNSDAFAAANPSYFDATYAKTGGDWMSEFRNYGPPTCSSAPTVLTTSLGPFDPYSAQAEIYLSDEGTGCTVTEQGIAYGTSANPTISGAHSAAPFTGLGPGSWTVTGLTPGTTYHYRAYAINSFGVAYGSDQVQTMPDEEITYYSDPIDQYFFANDGHCDSYTCPPFYEPGALYHMIASAGAFTSTISVDDANAQAQAYGQAAANAAACDCFPLPQ